MKLRLPVAGRTVAGAVIAIVLLACGGIWQVSRVLRLAREQVRSQRELGFRVAPFGGESRAPFEPISAPAVYAQAAQFRDHFFIAGPAGLQEYDAGGSLLKQYAAGRDLPSSPLVAVVTGVLADSHEPELLIATEQDGVLAFNGHAFRQIYPLDGDARTITSILPTAAGHLLVGTKKRGMLLYDGKHLTPLHPTLSSVSVTTLSGNESDLWVGTLNRGVAHWHAGQADWFGESEGLPDPQVLSITTDGDSTYVGTVMGVAAFDRGRFARVLAPGVLANALLVAKGELFVGSEDQGVLAIPLTARRFTPEPAELGAGFGGQDGEQVEVKQVFVSGEGVFALTRSALYRMGSHGLRWQAVLSPGASVLSDRNVSALAADESGHLWVGYFDRGLDVVEANGAHARHVEDEHVFCVNRILPDVPSKTIDVATANGLVRFDAEGNQEQLLTRADGLIADHITDVALYRGGLALATPAGLTFLDASGARSMYAFHGLVSNHIYALGVSGDELMVGTLGGLSVLEKGTVQLNYTTAGSGLTHNWITAVVPVDEGWMIGTYGAGVLGLEQGGHFRKFETGSGEFEVNPNAMLATPRHVFAGSLGQGLYVYERDSRRWFTVANGLPSLNVTALAARNGDLYVGTDNGLVRISEQELHP